MGRAPCCDKANVKRGPWSPEEDAKLKSYIESHGTGGNWIALPQKIGLKRCGKSCRLRWLNYLRPNIRHGGFTEDEDNLICSLYISIGSRWSIIAAQLPGRTDNDIKNYWNTRLKKKLLGRQRTTREQTKRSQGTMKGGHEFRSYAINECFNVYPQLAAPPFLPLPPPYSTMEASACEQEPNSLIDVPIISSSFPHSNSLGSLSYADQNYLVPSSTFHYNDLISSAPGFPGTDFQPIEENFSGGNMFFDSGTGAAAWGNANCPFYPCERKTPQDCTVFDEPRLLELQEGLL